MCITFRIWSGVKKLIRLVHTRETSSNNTVGFTLSQATKALRESRGIALLYFRPLH